MQEHETYRSILESSIAENAKAQEKLLATEFLFESIKSSCLVGLMMALEKGADVNATDISGLSALQTCVLCKHKKQVEMMRALLERGADPLWKNEYGTSAIDLATIFASLNIQREVTRS